MTNADAKEGMAVREIEGVRRGILHRMPNGWDVAHPDGTRSQNVYLPAWEPTEREFRKPHSRSLPREN